MYSAPVRQHPRGDVLGRIFVLRDVTRETEAERVLVNLLDNAIKYSPRGGAIRARVDASRDDELVVSVSDQGQGIPRQHLEHLSERLHRVDAGGRAVKGVGLGLFICRTLLRPRRPPRSCRVGSPGPRAPAARAAPQAPRALARRSMVTGAPYVTGRPAWRLTSEE